jgi:hypothetical protein
MNRKLMLGAAAGVAAVALAVGGTTYSAWSDFGDVNNNAAGAGHLVLNIDRGSLTAESMSLAPGQNQSRDFYIASNDGRSVPNGQLYITMSNLVNHEDGCTSNSEAVAEGIDPSQPGYKAGSACGSNADGNNNGELGSQARMEIIQYGPSDTGQCSNVSPVPTNSNVVQNFAFVNGLQNQKLSVVQLAPGQATCVRAIVQLPAGADNKVQGDSINWNFHFDLEQVLAP